jgi:hypothetical protein
MLHAPIFAAAASTFANRMVFVVHSLFGGKLFVFKEWYHEKQ